MVKEDGHNGTAMSPLVVDLDGTLVRTDLLHESVLRLLKTSPASLCAIPFWLLKGRGYMKQRIAEAAPLDARALPYNTELVEWLKLERLRGRRVFIATASNVLHAHAVAQHLGVFDGVFASDATTNLKGPAKRDRLVLEFGDRRIAYAGNAASDVVVWQSSAAAIPVNAPERVVRRAARIAHIERVFPSPEPSAVRSWFRAIRAQQWFKNLLLFVPLLTSHRFGEVYLVWHAVLAFVALSLVASGTYILNDLLDLSADRYHARKRDRPFAAGSIELWHGVAGSFLMIVAGLATSLVVSPLFSITVAIYLAVTAAYSIWIKRIAVLDVIILAVLYTLRVIAGGAAVAIVPSFWLLAFSMFVFSSLAVLKRFVELDFLRKSECESKVRGRGYSAEDVQVMSTLGVTSGVCAALVLALYVESPGVQVMYSKPWLIWAVCPVFLYWIGRIWLKAHRGEVHDDPVVFALTDRTSLLVAASTIAVFVAAR